MSEPVYKVHSGEDCLAAVPLEPKAIVKLAFRLGRERLAPEWTPLNFTFVPSDSGANVRPDLIVSPPTIAFRASLKEAIFPRPCMQVEFLPVVVGSEDWLSLNCLKTTAHYDRERSIFWRDPFTSSIVFVRALVVTDPSVRDCEIFTLEDSNRATPIVLDSFKRRIESLGLKGLSFEKIGTLEDG